MDLEEIVEELASTMGAEVVVEWSPPPPLPLPERARLRAAVRARVLECRACPLGPGRETVDGNGERWTAVASSPVPASAVDLGPLRNGLVTGVIGEAPGQEEDAKGVGFVGASGRLLRAMLYKAGFDQAWMVNAAACRPPRNRTPNVEEVGACSENLAAQLALGAAYGVRHWLLVGAVATKLWRPDLKISYDHGAVGVWREHGLMVMPIIHPAAVLRKRELKGLLVDDLAKWMEVVDDGTLAALETRCLRCFRQGDRVDDDGIAWCEKHAERYQPGAKKRRGKKDPGEGQGAFGDDWGVGAEVHRVDAD